MRPYLFYSQVDSTFWRHVFLFALVLLLLIATAAADAADAVDTAYASTSYAKPPTTKTTNTTTAKTASPNTTDAQRPPGYVICGPVQTSLQGKGDRIVTYRDVAKTRKVTASPQAPAGAGTARAAAAPPKPANPEGPLAVLHTDRGLRNVLETVRTSVAYQNISFEEAIEDLREQFKMNIIVYWPALAQAGIGKDYELSLTLNDVSVRRVLESLLAVVSSAGSDEISYQIDQGVLEIGLKDELHPPEEVRVYYIADLVAPRSDLYGGMGGYGGGGSGSGGSGSMGSGYGGYGSGGQESLQRALSEYGSFGRTFRGERNMGQYDSYHTRFGRGGGFRYQFPGMRGLRYRSRTGLYLR